MATAIPAAIGAVTVLAGVVMEAHGQGELLKHGGTLAVEAYQQAMSMHPIESFSEYVRLALAGQHQSFGGNTQGVGIGITLAGTAISAASVLLAKGFTKLKSAFEVRVAALNDKQVELTTSKKTKAELFGETPAPTAASNAPKADYRLQVTLISTDGCSGSFAVTRDSLGAPSNSPVSWSPHKPDGPTHAVLFQRLDGDQPKSSYTADGDFWRDLENSNRGPEFWDQALSSFPLSGVVNGMAVNLANDHLDRANDSEEAKPAFKLRM
jgi:hypothetical protein